MRRCPASSARDPPPKNNVAFVKASLTAHQKIITVAALLVVLGCTVSTATAESHLNKTAGDDIIAAPSSSSIWWSAFVDLCDAIAPYCAIVCFLAPLPTIKQISRDRTVGKLPLLPYTSMITQSVVWTLYGIMKRLPNVWGCNVTGALLGAYYVLTFVRHCGPMASNLPGTVGQHLRGAGAIMLFNVCLSVSGVANASDMIGKQGVAFCIIMFASPLAALKHVIGTKSAASIPLPFTLASFINCSAWSVLGLWKHDDFNIYFPNLMGLSCAVAQLALKGVYRNGGKCDKKDGLPA